MKPNKTTFKKGNKIGSETRLKSERVIGDKNINWKGDSVGYGALHSWIIRTYGKATKCTNKKCTKESKVFEWALLKGKDYKRDRNSFIELCHKCHKKYDVTDEYRKKMSIIRTNYWKKKKT